MLFPTPEKTTEIIRHVLDIPGEVHLTLGWLLTWFFGYIVGTYFVKYLLIFRVSASGFMTYDTFFVWSEHSICFSFNLKCLLLPLKRKGCVFDNERKWLSSFWKGPSWELVYICWKKWQKRSPQICNSRKGDMSITTLGPKPDLLKLMNVCFLCSLHLKNLSSSILLTSAADLCVSLSSTCPNPAYFSDCQNIIFSVKPYSSSKYIHILLDRVSTEFCFHL